MANVLDRNFDFATNGTVTAAGLHNLIDETNIYAGLISTQEERASVGTGDLLLIANSSSIASPQIAANRTTVYNLFDDALTGGTYANAQLSGNLTYGTATGNRTISTSATITNGTIANGVIPAGTFGTTTSTAATITSGTIPNLASTTGTIATLNSTTGTIATLVASAGTFAGSLVNVTTGTIGTLNSTTGTIATLNSTTGTISNLSTTLAGDFTISQGTGTLGTTGVTAGTYGTNTRAVSLTVDAKGRITTISTSAIAIITSGTATASTSGTAIDFTGIPSYAKRITVMLSNVSTNGASFLRMQLGVGGVATTTGYLGSCLAAITGALDVSTFSSGVDFSNSAADGDRKHGNVTFTNVTGDTWSFTGMTGLSNTGRMSYLSGSVPLSGTLDMVRVTTVNGTDAFDLGTINIMYEG